ncbi:MAG: class I SAM-dependent methyltransferase [Bacteroidales bacterium]|nr:class I SAM-dependent methyltransferase [Bacteroidales bacterium]
MKKKQPTNSEMRQVYFTNVRKEMTRFIPDGCCRILDVGCSEGNFGKLLKGILKAEVWGVELSENAGKTAALKLDKVFIGDFSEILPQLPEHYFDCLMFNDVLEHFTDPWNILIQCKKILCAGGYIVSSIPNVRYIGNLVELLIRKDWEYKSGGILDQAHYRFFTQKSIVRMFNQSGYAILSCTGINPTHSFMTNLLGILTLGFMSDCKFLEFATVAKST